MPTENQPVGSSNPRYTVEIIHTDEFGNIHAIRDSKTGALSAARRTDENKDQLAQFCDRLNNGRRHFHNIDWVLPNGTTIPGRY